MLNLYSLQNYPCKVIKGDLFACCPNHVLKWKFVLKLAMRRNDYPKNVHYRIM